MYKGGRPHNSIWELFLQVAVFIVGNKKYAKSLIISKLTMLPECKSTAKNLMDSVSSASIEQIFSNFRNIHTKVRNLLGNSKAFKLVLCYRILRPSLN